MIDSVTNEMAANYQKICEALDMGLISIILERATDSIDGGLVVCDIDEVLEYINQEGQ